MMNIRTFTLASIFALTCGGALLPVYAHAQATTISLGAIDTLLARSRFRDAAAALDAWEREHATSITTAERATALLLRARMTQEGDSARAVYLTLSLGYPSSPEAPVAMLRLGQLAAASGDVVRAKSYFQRVVKDYPTSPVHDEAVEWLAKTNSGALTQPRNATTTNGAATSKSTSSTPNPVTTRAQNSQGSAPKPPASAGSTPAASAQSGAPAVQGGAPAVEGGATAAQAGAFALQVGAFREASTAATVARQMAKRGFEARVVTVSGSTLSRVRVGRFATSRASEETMRRLRAAGYEAVVVDDARLEVVTSK
jgi:cell division septation protein DedD